MKAALLISVSEYKNPDNNLPGCEQDLAVMQSLLEDTEQYSEILALSGSKINARDLKDRISEWIDKQRGKKLEEIFFYYSGHGVFVDGEFFFQLYDFDHSRKHQTSLTNSDLDVWLRSLSAPLTVKVIDACNSGVPYIKGMQDSIEKYFNDSGNGFQNCIFMYSSTVTQSSYQNSEISDFTKAFVDAVRKYEGEVARYRNISEYIADEFAGHNDLDKQAPVFVIQAHNTEIFCYINDKIRQLVIQEQSKKDVIIQNEPKLLGLKQMAEEAAKSLASKEIALNLLGELKTKLETFQYKPELTEIYNFKYKVIEAKQVPLRTSIGHWLEDNRHNYFAAPTYTTVYDDPMDAMIAQQSTMFGASSHNIRRRGRQEISGFQFTADVPFEAFQIIAQRKYESLPHYYCAITYLVSKSKVTFYFYYTAYRDKNWDDTSLELDVMWRKIEADFASPDIILKTAADILSGFESYILEQVSGILSEK
jgi:hypothetical protein